jgi:hypothetical protein
VRDLQAERVLTDPDDHAFLAELEALSARAQAKGYLVAAFAVEILGAAAISDCETELFRALDRFAREHFDDYARGATMPQLSQLT